LQGFESMLTKESLGALVDGSAGMAHYFAETVKRQVSKIGPEHGDRAFVHYVHGVLLSAAREKEEARRELGEALRVQQKLFGSEHPDTIASRKALELLDRPVGATVIMTTSEAQLMAGEKVLATVPAGQKLAVEYAYGDWFRVTVEQKKAAQRGYIKADRVRRPRLFSGQGFGSIGNVMTETALMNGNKEIAVLPYLQQVEVEREEKDWLLVTVPEITSRVTGLVHRNQVRIADK
jgi:hypothetical protein